MEWARDDSIKGDMKIASLGSEILIAREVQNKNMTDFLSITANEFDMPLVRRPNILRKIAGNMGFEAEDVIKTDKQIQKELATPDPIEEKLKELAIEKAELENSEIQSRIAVNQSERDKNISEAKYKGEFLRQRRIKLAEDIKLARKQQEIDAKAAKEGATADVKKKIKVKAKPVKILNE
jgi:Xaa-Pro aminopeptidase